MQLDGFGWSIKRESDVEQACWPVLNACRVDFCRFARCCFLTQAPTLFPDDVVAFLRAGGRRHFLGGALPVT